MVATCLRLCRCCSFENGWFDGSNNLSPIGTMQVAAKRWSEASPNALGVHTATVALVLDFFTGFTPPRHLVSVGRSYVPRSCPP